MNIKISRINRGVILLVVAVTGVLIYLGVDAIDAGRKKKQAKTLASEIVLASKDCLVIDKSMPLGGSFANLNDIDNELVVSQEERIAKLKPYLYQDERLYDEIANLGDRFAEMAFWSDGLMVQQITSRTPLNYEVSYYNNTATVVVEVMNDCVTQSSSSSNVTSQDILGFEYLDNGWQLVSYRIETA